MDGEGRGAVAQQLSVSDLALWQPHTFRPSHRGLRAASGHRAALAAADGDVLP
jgi:hypothetical protein